MSRSGEVDGQDPHVVVLHNGSSMMEAGFCRRRCAVNCLSINRPATTTFKQCSMMVKCGSGLIFKKSKEYCIGHG